MSASTQRHVAATPPLLRRITCLVLAVVLAVGLCPAPSFAATGQGSVTVTFKDTTGATITTVTGQGSDGVAYAKADSSGSSLVDTVDGTIKQLESKGYTQVSNNFVASGKYAGGKSAAYAVTFKKPATSKATINFVDQSNAAIATVSGSGVAGTLFSAKAGDGKSLNDRYTEALNGRVGAGYKLVSSDYNTSGKYAASDQTFTVRMTNASAAGAQSGVVKVTIVDESGKELGSASGQNVVGKTFEAKPANGDSLWVAVNNRVIALKNEGCTVKSWGGFARTGTYTASAQTFTVTVAVPNSQVTVNFVDEAGKSLGTVTGTEGPGVTFATVNKDGKSLNKQVEAMISHLKGDAGYVVKDRSGYPAQGAFKAAPQTFKIVMSKVDNAVSVKFVDTEGASLGGTVTAAGGIGKAFSTTNLPKLVSDQIATLTKSGYTVVQNDFDANAKFTTARQTITVKLRKPAASAMGKKVTVTYVDQYGNNLGSASGTGAVGVAFSAAGNTLNATVQKRVSELKTQGFTVTNWGGYSAAGTYKALEQRFTITFKNPNGNNSLTDCDITGVTAKTYTGRAITQNVVVKNKKTGATLKQGTDYTLTYKNNVKAGTGTVEVTGKGAYTGTFTLRFQISPANINGATLAAAAQKYTGRALTPKLSTATFNGMKLTEGVDYELKSYANNTNPGTGSINVVGKGNFANSTVVRFNISTDGSTKKDVNAKSFTVSGMVGQVYTGKALAPAPIVKDGLKTLTAGTDYTVAYRNNVNAGTAVVTITGKGAYTGTRTETFKIVPASIANKTAVKVTGIQAKTYTGNIATQNATLTWNGKKLVAGTDYTVAYANNTNPGTATVTFTGKGNFTNTYSVAFPIAKGDISKAQVSAIAAQKFTGKAIEPKPVVTLAGKTLAAGTDYTLSYKNNTAKGTATVTITGKGNYAGTATRTFVISADGSSKVDIASSKISVTAPAAQAYTGSPLTPKPTVKLGTRVLTEGVDYALSYRDNVNRGKGVITIAGAGAYTGSRTVTFAIGQASIAQAQVSGVTFGAYTGKAQKPKPSVTFNGQPLVEGADYTVAYRNNVHVGLAHVIITGKGLFAGTKDVSAAITPADITKATISGVVDKAYTGSAVTQRPVVTLGGTTLAAGTDYTVSYRDNTKAGNATVVITGTGNYVGTISKAFAIKAAAGNATDISSATISGINNVIYSGRAFTLKPTVKLGGKTLEEGADYTLSYKNNVNVGTATVIVAGTGAYKGTKTATFKITRARIGIPAAEVGLTYNGKPQVGVKPAAGYAVTGNSATNAGTYTARVTPDGNHMWADGTWTAKSVLWAIGKAQPALVVTPMTVSATAQGAAQNVAVAYKGDGAVSVTSDNPKIATATYAQGKVTIKPLVAGKVNVNVIAAAGKNYRAKAAVITVNVGAKPAPTYPANYTGWKEVGGKSYYYIKGVKQGTQGRGCEIFDGKAWYWLDAVQGGAKTTNKFVFIPYFYSNDSMNKSNQSNPLFGKWVFYDKAGQMLKGWHKVAGKQYYFDAQTGEMAHGVCFLPSGGKRVSIFDTATGEFKGSSNTTNWEYWYEGGAKQGVQGRGKEIFDPYSNAWYWLDSLYNGKKAVNKEVMIPYTFNGKDHIQKWVRYDATGHMVKGWYRTGGGTWYYDVTTGAMAKGKRTIDGKSYTFDSVTGVLR